MKTFHFILRLGQTTAAQFIPFDLKADDPNQALEKLIAALQGATIAHAHVGDETASGPGARIQYPELKGRQVFVRPPESALPRFVEVPLFETEAEAEPAKV